MELSYCIVNTNQREHLLRCLAAIRETHPQDVAHDVIVLDNASDDGSVEAVREADFDVRLIARERRAGLAENNTVLLQEASGELCLLLNEDSELLPGATGALLEALRSDRAAAAAGAQLIWPSGKRIGCARRLPGLGTALAEALQLDRWLTVQVDRSHTRDVGWSQSAALLVRREAAAEVGYFDTDYFVYFEEVDFQKRLHDAGWRILHVPAARVIHHQQLATDRSAGARRVVEFHRMRDLYMRKHHTLAAALAVRCLAALGYAIRGLVALVVPGRDPGWHWLHAQQALQPDRGEGMREAAERGNASRAKVPAAARESALR